MLNFALTRVTIKCVLDYIEKERGLDLETEKLKLKFEKAEQFRLDLQARDQAKVCTSKFKRTPEDWIRFEVMFTVQKFNNKLISAEEKFGHLLELVEPKIRDCFANLKPGESSYQTAWDRLKSEYGQTKTVIAAPVDQIIHLPVVRGARYKKVHEF